MNNNTDATNMADDSATNLPFEELTQTDLDAVCGGVLTIKGPGDKYEQEADRVASQIMNLIHRPKKNSKNSRRR